MIEQSDNSSSKKQQKQQVSLKSYIRIFGFIVLSYQIFICIIYGIVLRYNQNNVNGFNDLLIPAAIALIALLGFGLTSTYFSQMTLEATGMTIMLFSISVQQYFLCRQFWSMAKISSPNNLGFSNNPLSIIELTNSQNNRQSSDFLISASFADAFACAVCMIICLRSVLGRIGPIQVFLLGLIGPFIYQLNYQILWRLFVTDCGFGMRIFLFGSTMSIASSFVFSRDVQQLKIESYNSNYHNKTYSLLGTIIIWILFPAFCLVDIFNKNNQSSIDLTIVPVAALNMWLGLISGTIGVFCMSILIHGRFQINQIIDCIFAGGIIFSCCADLILNPTFPLTTGTIFGCLAVMMHNRYQPSLLDAGFISNYPTIIPFFLPSIIAGILSAVVQAAGTASSNDYKQNTNSNYTSIQAGGIQMAGVAISIGLGLAGGILIGIIYRLLSFFKDKKQYFHDQAYYEKIKQQ